MSTPATLQEKFSRRVRELREAKGFTQEDFAAEADIERAYYGAIERGKKNVTLATVEKIARGLKVKPRDLFTF